MLLPRDSGARLSGPSVSSSIFDTAPEGYVDEKGSLPSGSCESERLTRDLRRAAALLRRRAFQDPCLQDVWRGLAVRYDRARDRLVPLAKWLCRR